MKRLSRLIICVFSKIIMYTLVVLISIFVWQIRLAYEKYKAYKHYHTRSPAKHF